MVEADKATEENPYILSTNERTCPKGVSMEEKAVWLGERIALQREGIDHGVNPQLLFGVPRILKPRWGEGVWDYYLSTLSKEERRAIKQQTGPSAPRHTRPFARDRRGQ